MTNDPFDLIERRATATEIQALTKQDFSDESIRQALGKWLGAETPSADREPEPWQVRYSLLRFAMSSRSSRVFTAQLESGTGTLDRDRFVVELWKKLAKADEVAVIARHHSLRYHRRRLFDWLVDRYALSCARDIFGMPSLPAWLPLGGALVALFINWRDTIAERRLGGLWFLAAGYVAATVLAVGLREKERGAGIGESVFFFLQSLIPRLMGTAAAGALLLLTGSSLLEWIAQASPGTSLLGSLAVFGAASAYLLLEMLNRLEPAPKWTVVARRLTEVVALAMTHSTLLTLLLWPAFAEFSNVYNAGFHQFASVIVALFATGLVLNVIWAEEPITHPL
jgi:hypothetical protein